MDPPEEGRRGAAPTGWDAHVHSLMLVIAQQPLDAIVPVNAATTLSARDVVDCSATCSLQAQVDCCEGVTGCAVPRRI